MVLAWTTEVLAGNQKKEKSEIKVFLSLDPFLQGCIGLALSLN